MSKEIVDDFFENNVIENDVLLRAAKTGVQRQSREDFAQGAVSQDDLLFIMDAKPQKYLQNKPSDS